MNVEKVYTGRMNKALRGLFRNALSISLGSPSMAFFILKSIWRQKKAAALRRKWDEKGVQVPPYMILSVTGRCNLRCKGCYAHAQHRTEEKEMSSERLAGVIREAHELGISVIMLAGGEPFVRPEILDITKNYPDIIFPLFTNGMLIDDDIIARLKEQKNVVPVISMEGYKEDTDGRRGEGVYQHIRDIARKLKNNGIFYGTSLTVTRSNYPTVTDDSFLRGLADEGCRLFFFVEYVPFKEGTEDWVLTDSQRAELLELTGMLKSEIPALFIAFPGDEEKYGGCMSAGRGFVHISPNGSLEPCPFAPFSDSSILDIPLKQALKSEFLKTIRNNHGQLVETSGGCALWEKREWVQSLLS